MPDRYAAVPGIRSFDFGDEWVIMNPLSWDAHLLNAAAAIVLDLLDTDAQTEDEVAETLRDVLVETEQAEAPAHAHRLITELLQLGLVRPVPVDAGTDR